MKNILLTLFLTTSLLVVSQETCETPQETLEDLNSITKCSIKSSKKSKDQKSRQISVKVSASKNRYLKKRNVQKKSLASSANNLNGSGVAETNLSSEMSNNIIANLSNSLSADEVRRANKFNNVDQIPLFSACESAKKKDRLDCFNDEMIKHIQQHFKYPSNAVINKIQGDVWVRFIIDQNGHVSNIKTLGPKDGKILDQEAIRVVSKLPRFSPGIKEGKKIPVKYGFPISFSLED